MPTLEHQNILSRKHWVFDMDGTLTLAKHDFDAIRAELGLPFGLPILESLESLPAEEAAQLNRRLDVIELDIAERSEPADGAAELLESLLSQGAQIGILTRNNAINIHVSLKAAGLLHYFAEDDLISRECAMPKPAPDGIHKLLSNWQASISDSVMVGDSILDLDAGRNAQTATIYVDPSGEFVYKEAADICVTHLSALIL